MPTYAYRCTACSHEFDAVQSFSDPAIEECPTCGELTRRVFHPAGIIFKGEGWYVNDSRKKPAEPKESASKKETGTKTDDAPKSTSDTKASTDSAPSTPAPAATAPAD